MDIRHYEDTDRAACLEICESAGAARAEFEAFLDSGIEWFFVMEHEGAVVGCGGYSITGVLGILRWGMVRKEFREMGLGRFLLLYRMREIGKAGDVELVLARVPTDAAGFFLKQGFKKQNAGDGWVELAKKLVVCA